MNSKYRKVALGGTFDLLHTGHKTLILKAFELSNNVVIGITTDKFSKKQTFEDQNLRLKKLLAFLRGRKYKIGWLDDIFGTTLDDSSIEALIVSPETKHAGQVINKERAKRGLKELDIAVVPFVKDEIGNVISSTRIRNGEISPEGISYRKLILKVAGKQLSETTKNKLKKPFGKIISIASLQAQLSNLTSEGRSLLITVGDITTKKFLEAGITPKLAIVDLKVARKVAFKNLHELGFNGPADIAVKNKPGQISRSLILAVENSLKKDKQIIEVLGEEDLAVIPAVLLSPLGTNVFYGQPQKGLVLVNVDLEIKNKASSLLV